MYIRLLSNYFLFINFIEVEIKLYFSGFPLNIPELSWEELKSFHASHYHPSNSRIFTYGDIPLETHLSTLDSYLDKFQYLNLNTAVPKETRLVYCMFVNNENLIFLIIISFWDYCTNSMRYTLKYMQHWIKLEKAKKLSNSKNS